MAKRDDKQAAADGASRSGSVRAAVDQALQATAEQAEGTQRRVQELADELTSVVGRLREGLDSARPVTGGDLDDLRAEITAVSKRVAALEKTATGSRPAARKPQSTAAKAAKKPAKSRATASSKVPAARAAARRSAGKRPS